jgi:methionyl-tRNA formyltransferase
METENVNIKNWKSSIRKLNKIDWNKTAIEIHNLIRGLSPYPSAWTKDEKSNKILKIFEVIFHKEKNSKENLSGTIIIKNNTIKIITYDGFLEVLELQLEGKKRMSYLEFINGYKNFHYQRLS